MLSPKTMKNIIRFGLAGLAALLIHRVESDANTIADAYFDSKDKKDN